MTRVVAFAPAMLSQYVDGVYQKATVKIKTAIQAGKELALPHTATPAVDMATPVLTESLVSSIRYFKDVFVLVVRSSAVLRNMPRADKACYDSLKLAFADIVVLLR